MQSAADDPRINLQGQTEPEILQGPCGGPNQIGARAWWSAVIMAAASIFGVMEYDVCRGLLADQLEIGTLRALGWLRLRVTRSCSIFGWGPWRVPWASARRCLSTGSPTILW